MISIRKVSVIRGPDLLSMQFPAVIFHTFISDIRERINKGLRIAEEAIESSKTADNIRRIRNEYRSAMRGGIIDSVEDLDVVLLAKEIGGAVLSADEGIAKMADSLGIEVFSAKDFKINLLPEKTMKAENQNKIEHLQYGSISYSRYTERSPETRTWNCYNTRRDREG